MNRFLRRLLTPVAVGFVLCPADARAHRIPGVKALNPGDAFTIGSFKGMLRGADGHYALGPIDMAASRDGSALAFLIFDPVAPRDVLEAKKFEAELKKLPHTHAFLVLPPARSVTVLATVLAAMDRTGLSLPTIIDDRDVFPYMFQHSIKTTPRYELFDRTQTLVIENASALTERVGGSPVQVQIHRLDRGEKVEPIAVSNEQQADYDPRE